MQKPAVTVAMIATASVFAGVIHTKGAPAAKAANALGAGEVAAPEVSKKDNGKRSRA